MLARSFSLCCLIGLLPALCAPAQATVRILSMKPSLSSPTPIGSSITWTVLATDSSPGPLTFQFNVALPGRPLALARDFNVGTFYSVAWASPVFVWTPTISEGIYQIQAVVKDFTSGESASRTVQFQISPLVSGSSPVVVPTANPLVALFSAPSCPAGSHMRVSFQQQSKATPATTTNWTGCHPPGTMTFEIAGMYPNTTYEMSSQTVIGGSIVNGPTLTFTTGTLPAGIPFPKFQVVLGAGGQTDAANSVLLLTPVQLGNRTNFPAVASDLSGNIIWYHYPSSSDHFEILTRPLAGGAFLTIQDDVAWNPASSSGQFLRAVDLAGNIILETNTGAIQQQLLALGATDAQACNAVPRPAPVGGACLNSFHHDAIRSLPNGQTALLAAVEKIFPPGTQGDTTGLPVDIVGDMIIVLDANWQVVWYFDSFQHDGGGSQLDINRPAVLGETCTNGQAGCQPMLLLGPGIAPQAKDWLHANTLYYWPRDGSLIWSSRHQDWVMKVDYNNGSGAGNILWRMGPYGDFIFNNVYNDTWPWFSHQHDAGMENNGAGPLTVFDNGNTRISQLGGGNSRGMALQIDEAQMQVTPLLSADLGVFSQALGSAQLLSGGDYFFLAPAVVIGNIVIGSYSLEILPTPGTDTGTQVWNVLGTESYRAWRMPSLYKPPTT